MARVPNTDSTLLKLTTTSSNTENEAETGKAIEQRFGARGRSRQLGIDCERARQGEEHQ